MRTKYSFLNMMVGVGGQVVNMVLAFVSRLIFIQYLSASYLGVNGLFSNILGMLNLAELGIGSAMIFSMYRPAAVDDRENLGRLMNLYRLMYRGVAAVVLILGLILLPFLDLFVKKGTGVPHLQLIYLMYLANTVCSYLLSYKNSIFLANQRAYIRTTCEQIFHFIQIIAETLVLILTGNFFLYLAIQLFTQIAVNLIVAWKADREYPYLKDIKGFPDREQRRGIIRNIMAMTLHRLGGVMVKGTDNLLLSAFVGLGSVGIYSNYKLILVNIEGIMNRIYNAFAGSVGNLGATEETDKIYEVYRGLDFLMFLFYGYIAAALMVLFNPFIRLFFGKEYLFSAGIVFLMVADLYFTGMRQINLQFRTALGLFWHDRYKPVAEVVINLTVSLMLVQKYGVAGVFAGTLISGLTVCFWIEPLVLMRYGFQENWRKKLFDYFAEYGMRIVSMSVAGGAGYFICRQIQIINIMQFILAGILFTVAYYTVILLIYGRTQEFQLLWKQGKNFLSMRKNR